jgi:hypothetical protein
MTEKKGFLEKPRMTEKKGFLEKLGMTEKKGFLEKLGMTESGKDSSHREGEGRNDSEENTMRK